MAWSLAPSMIGACDGGCDRHDMIRQNAAHGVAASGEGRPKEISLSERVSHDEHMLQCQVLSDRAVTSGQIYAHDRTAT